MGPLNEAMNLVLAIATVGMSWGIVKTQVEALREGLKRVDDRLATHEDRTVSDEKFALVVDSLKSEIAELKQDLKEILRVLNGRED